MNAGGTKRLTLIKSLVEEQGADVDKWWLIAQLEAEATEVERLMVLATRYNDECITAEIERDALRERVRELDGALRGMLIIMDRGPVPRKLDEALTWKQNDEQARAVAFAALAPRVAPASAVEGQASIAEEIPRDCTRYSIPTAKCQSAAANGAATESADKPWERSAAERREEEKK